MINEEQKYTNAQILRQKAEEKLKAKQDKIDQSVKELDVIKLVHELQVHQIELEMQNEELQMAVEVAEAALKKNTILYDLAPMGYFTLDAFGSINDLNLAGAKMLGGKRFSLINTNFKSFVAEEAKSVFDNFFDVAFKSNEKVSCEVMLGNDKNPLCYVYMEGVVVFDDQKCFLSVVDISGSSSAHQFQIPIF